jgi:hypothetical protein
MLLLISIFLILPAATDLSDRQLARLNRGETIILNKKIKGAPWPELTYFHIIKASPEECAAILSNYHLQKNFTEDLTRVEIRNVLSPTHKIVAFFTDVPWPAADDMTVTDNQLSHSGSGTYQIKWVMVKSTSLKKNSGSATFIPHGNLTLYRYQTFVHPRSALAGMFKSRMIKKVKNAVISFASYVEGLKAKNHPLLKKSMTELRSALKRGIPAERRSSASGGGNENFLQITFFQHPGWNHHHRRLCTTHGR